MLIKAFIHIKVVWVFYPGTEWLKAWKEPLIEINAYLWTLWLFIFNPRSGRRLQLSERALKPTRFTSPLLCPRTKQYRLLRVDLGKPSCEEQTSLGKRFRPTEALRKDPLQPNDLPAGCAVAPGSQLLWAVPCARVGLGDAAASESFLLLFPMFQ